MPNAVISKFRLPSKELSWLRLMASIKGRAVLFEACVQVARAVTVRLVEGIQELRDYLGPEAQGLSDEYVIHKVMCKALEYQSRLSELRSRSMAGEVRQDIR